MRELTVRFEEIANLAGYKAGADGRLNLPNTQETADKLTATAAEMFSTEVGDEPISLTITGGGPIWAYLSVAHGFHGRVLRLVYASPGVIITIWAHGVPKVTMESVRIMREEEALRRQGQ